MTTKVNINIEVGIEEIFSELNQQEQEDFIVDNINSVGDIDDVVNKCFRDTDIYKFIENNLYRVSDDALLEEAKRRGLEVL